MNKSSENWIYIGIGLAALLFVAMGIFTFSASSENKPSQVSEENLVRENSTVLGSRDAKVTVVEFADFQCPACGAAHPIVKQVLAEYGDSIFYVYRHFPILTAHRYALKAAEAAEAAGEQGKFWQYHDILFENQENLTEADLVKYAERLNLDTEKFKSSLESGKYKDKIFADMDDGNKLGVSATPTFFINGKKYQGVIGLEEFRSIIEAQLNK